MKIDNKISLHDHHELINMPLYVKHIYMYIYGSISNAYIHMATRQGMPYIYIYIFLFSVVCQNHELIIQRQPFKLWKLTIKYHFMITMNLLTCHYIYIYMEALQMLIYIWQQDKGCHKYIFLFSVDCQNRQWTRGLYTLLMAPDIPWQPDYTLS